MTLTQSDAFIGILREEYKICTNRANNRNNNGTNGTVNLVKTPTATGTSKSLAALIADHKADNGPYCEHGKRPGH